MDATEKAALKAAGAELHEATDVLTQQWLALEQEFRALGANVHASVGILLKDRRGEYFHLGWSHLPFEKKKRWCFSFWHPGADEDHISSAPREVRVVAVAAVPELMKLVHERMRKLIADTEQAAVQLEELLARIAGEPDAGSVTGRMEGPK